jgi:hypothetical protein
MGRVWQTHAPFRCPVVRGISSRQAASPAPGSWSTDTSKELITSSLAGDVSAAYGPGVGDTGSGVGSETRTPVTLPWVRSATPPRAVTSSTSWLSATVWSPASTVIETRKAATIPSRRCSALGKSQTATAVRGPGCRPRPDAGTPAWSHRDDGAVRREDDQSGHPAGRFLCDGPRPD